MKHIIATAGVHSRLKGPGGHDLSRPWAGVVAIGPSPWWEVDLIADRLKELQEIDPKATGFRYPDREPTSRPRFRIGVGRFARVMDAVLDRLEAIQTSVNESRHGN